MISSERFQSCRIEPDHLLSLGDFSNDVNLDPPSSGSDKLKLVSSSKLSVSARNVPKSDVVSFVLGEPQAYGRPMDSSFANSGARTKSLCIASGFTGVFNHFDCIAFGPQLRASATITIPGSRPLITFQQRIHHQHTGD